MARFRLSRLARVDLAGILATSTRRWDIEGKRRYVGILSTAMRNVAANPEGTATRGRPELGRGIRSFHIRHARGEDPHAQVRKPAHVLYYRIVRPDLVEIVRVLHERMEPSQHLGAAMKEED